LEVEDEEEGVHVEVGEVKGRVEEGLRGVVVFFAGGGFRGLRAG